MKITDSERYDESMCPLKKAQLLNCNQNSYGVARSISNSQ